jgi:uncharacterized protein YpiB (UPF0302 family)
MYNNYSKKESLIANIIIGHYDFLEDAYDHLEDTFYEHMVNSTKNNGRVTPLCHNVSRAFRNKFQEYNHTILDISLFFRDTTLHTDRPINLELHHWVTIHRNLDTQITTSLPKYISPKQHNEIKEVISLICSDSRLCRSIEYGLKDILEDCIQTNTKNERESHS